MSDVADFGLGGVSKRGFDIVFALMALPFALPFILLSACWIKLASPGPAIFMHRRVGYQGRVFPCLKLRTMYVDADVRLAEILASDPAAKVEFEYTQKLKNDPRIVPGIGKILRKSSMDELPQFLNVLLGQMSVVGPRPVTRSEFRKYGVYRAAYRKARPGVTGLWQISGRNNMSFDERVSIDQNYVNTWSFTRDLMIVIKTVRTVIKGSGAF